MEGDSRREGITSMKDVASLGEPAAPGWESGCHEAILPGWPSESEAMGSRGRVRTPLSRGSLTADIWSRGV